MRNPKWSESDATEWSQPLSPEAQAKATDTCDEHGFNIVTDQQVRTINFGNGTRTISYDGPMEFTGEMTIVDLGSGITITASKKDTQRCL